MATQLMDGIIIKLLLSYMDNESINQVLKKAPMKQGIVILPAEATRSIRDKVIQTLSNAKNLKYVINVFESGTFNIFINNDYTDQHRLSLDDLKAHISETEGLGLDYLVYLISKRGISAIIELFDENLNNVSNFSDYLKNQQGDNLTFTRNVVEEESTESVRVRNLETENNKLHNENRKLQKKHTRNIEKLDRDYHQKLVTQQNEIKVKYDNIIEQQQIEIKKLELDIIKYKTSIKTQEKEYQKLLIKTENIETKLKANDKLEILIIGELPESSILDATRYQIFVISEVEYLTLEDMIQQHNFVKIYLQSEYVSSGEYYRIKKKYTTLPIKYISQATLRKEL